MTQICLHFLVSGQVQGVFYRATAQKKAKELGIRGWIRNLPNGKVEGIACGDETKVDIFCTWLKQGPVQAKVENIEFERVNFEPYESFSIMR